MLNLSLEVKKFIAPLPLVLASFTTIALLTVSTPFFSLLSSFDLIVSLIISPYAIFFILSSFIFIN